MDKLLKNKIFTWLLGLLLLANAATLVFFWIGRPGGDIPKGSPQEFLTKELNLNKQQQEQFDVLRREHRSKTEALREKVKAAKDELFELIKEPNATDSAKQLAARGVSMLTEEIDINTVNHFQKVRALCTPEQQQKFDGIIRQLTRMMANQRPGRPQGPPPGDGEHDGPPKDGGEHQPPPADRPGPQN